jgi:Lrp/AsnC family leucine-responsive transcriptional regulator
MPVLINFKICDNSSECSGIPICPVKAITWNEKKKTLEIDNKKCTSCGLCERSCMVGAIKVAKTEEEFEKFKKEIKDDKRKISDLFVDRYGAQPIHEAFLDKEENFNNLIKISKIPIVIELFNGNSIKCLLYSIPTKDLFPVSSLRYRKVELSTDNLLKKYKIKVLPALLFFRDEKLIGKIEGYYGKDKKEEIDDIDKKILSNLSMNARTTIIELSRKVKISPRLLIYRIKNLEKKEMIMAYRPLLNFEKFNLTYYKIFLTLNQNNSEKIDEVENFLEENKQIIYTTRAFGSYDFEFECLFEKDLDLFKFIDSIREKFPDLIKNFEILTFEKVFKQSYFPE